MADCAVRRPRALLPPGDFLALAQRALVRRSRSGADVAVVAVGIEEAPVAAPTAGSLVTRCWAPLLSWFSQTRGWATPRPSPATASW